MNPRHAPLLAIALLASGLAPAVPAQVVLPPLPALPVDADRTLSLTLRTVDRELAGLRRLEIRKLLRRHRRVLDTDRHGAPIVRSEVIALDPAADALDRARGRFAGRPRAPPGRARAARRGAARSRGHAHPRGTAHAAATRSRRPLRFQSPLLREGFALDTAGALAGDAAGRLGSGPETPDTGEEASSAGSGLIPDLSPRVDADAGTEADARAEAGASANARARAGARTDDGR